MTGNIYDYLSELVAAKDRYTIIISAIGDASCVLDADIFDRLNALDLSVDWMDEFRGCYAAVVEQGTVIYERHENEKIELSGEFDCGRMSYAITSGG